MSKKKEAVTVDHPIVQKKIDRSLKLSVGEGSAAAVSSGLGPSYFSAYAIAMNASSYQVGFLHAIMSLMPSLSQVASAKLIERFRRKVIVLFGVFVEFLMFIPIILAGYFYCAGYPNMVWMLTLFAGLYFVFNGIAVPSWFSWMGSLVPENKRGSYFSRRTKVCSFFNIATMIGSAIFLDWIKRLGIAQGNEVGYTFLGFGIIFSVALFARFLSWTVLTSQYEPKITVRKKDYFSFWQLVKNGMTTPFGKFIRYRFLFSIAMGLAAPFWAVYMLRNLGMSYIWFMAVSVSAPTFQILFLRLHGRLSDKYGNVSVMRISSFVACLAPLFWYLSSFIDNLGVVQIYLVIVPGLTSGFFWAGYNLSTANYVYDTVHSRKRSFGVSYMNLVVGLGGFIGAMIGSGIAYVGVPFMDTILFIFLLAFFSRLLITTFAGKSLEEVRKVKKFDTNCLFREFHPWAGIRQGVHSVEHMVKKVEHHI